ncbi:MAG: EAL domain-containing protein, partial [Gallionellaceae bacterium]
HDAKTSGAENCQIYQSTMDAHGKDHLILGSALHRALAHQEFVLHYQPQFNLVSGQIVGMEALLRWQPKGGELIPPGKFIPILEETGLIVPVGEWVLRTACVQNKRWQDEGLPPVCIAVNLSVIQFRQTSLVPTIKKVLEETGLSSQFLELEITENIAMNDEEETITVLKELRAIGVKISIDDFGTGYSSLSYLKRFPIDKLKIDQSFVRDYQLGANDDGIVKAIVAMGHGLNLKVIAEGVETLEQADFLRRNHCDEVQGYFYARPMENTALGLLMKKAEETIND